MNHLSKILLSSLVVTSLWSCTKDENKIYFEGGTNPVLTSSVTTATLPLSFANKDQEAMKLSWTNPNYQFTTGISSQDVNYTVEFDTTSNFSNPLLQSVGVSKELSRSFTQNEVNDYLTNTLKMPTGQTRSVSIRVKSNLGTNAATLYSNIIKYNVTPFATPPKVEPPGTLANNYADGALWLVGDAAAGGWDNPLKSPYDVSQKFTRVSTTLYQLTIALKGSGGYKLVQTMGVWGTQYHALDGTKDLSGDFEKKDSDPQFPSPAAAGTYKITIDFQAGKYTLVKQ